MPTERPVFVATGDRRARCLRYGGAVAVLAGCLWLAALAIGMFGFGLPGVSLPSVGRAAEKPSTERAQPTNPPSARVSEAAATAPGLGLQRRAAAAQSRPKVVRPARGSRRTTTTKVSRPTRAHSAPQPSPPTQVVQPVDPQPAPAPAQQGWAERGWTAPPGQTRRTEPAPAAASPGQARRNGGEETTAPAEPAPAPVPPGQQKQPEDPTPNG